MSATLKELQKQILVYPLYKKEYRPLEEIRQQVCQEKTQRVKLSVLRRLELEPKKYQTFQEYIIDQRIKVLLPLSQAEETLLANPTYFQKSSYGMMLLGISCLGIAGGCWRKAFQEKALTGPPLNNLMIRFAIVSVIVALSLLSGACLLWRRSNAAKREFAGTEVLQQEQREAILKTILDARQDLTKPFPEFYDSRHFSEDLAGSDRYFTQNELDSLYQEWAQMITNEKPEGRENQIAWVNSVKNSYQNVVLHNRAVSWGELSTAAIVCYQQYTFHPDARTDFLEKMENIYRFSLLYNVWPTEYQQGIYDIFSHVRQDSGDPCEQLFWNRLKQFFEEDPWFKDKDEMKFVLFDTWWDGMSRLANDEELTESTCQSYLGAIKKRIIQRTFQALLPSEETENLPNYQHNMRRWFQAISDESERNEWLKHLPPEFHG